MSFYRTLLVTLICGLLCLPKLQGAELHTPETWTDEASFLAQAGPEWHEVAPSVWEKQEIDGSTLQLGFGIASFELALEQRRSERDRLVAELQSAPYAGALYFKKREHLVALEAEIDYLRRGTEAERHAVPLKGTTSESGLLCSGSYSLEATTTTQLRKASGSAEAFFYRAGPIPGYLGTLFASVTATSNLGVDSDWLSYSFDSGCCHGVTAQASMTGGACRVESRAYIQFSDGCTAYRTITRSEDCPDIDPPGDN